MPWWQPNLQTNTRISFQKRNLECVLQKHTKWDHITRLITINSFFFTLYSVGRQITQQIYHDSFQNLWQEEQQYSIREFHNEYHFLELHKNQRIPRVFLQITILEMKDYNSLNSKDFFLLHYRYFICENIECCVREINQCLHKLQTVAGINTTTGAALLFSGSAVRLPQFLFNPYDFPSAV